MELFYVYFSKSEHSPLKRTVKKNSASTINKWNQTEAYWNLS